MSSADYVGTWVNGVRYSIGSSRFRGQTRDKLQLDGSILRTTYGYGIQHGTGMVCTISERIKPIIPVSQKEMEKLAENCVKKPDIVDRMLNNAYQENQWHEDSHV